MDETLKKTVDTLYDEKNREELARRLKREPTLNELKNSENDSDLVTEVMWQVIKDLSERVVNLEAKLVSKNIV